MQIPFGSMMLCCPLAEGHPPRQARGMLGIICGSEHDFGCGKTFQVMNVNSKVQNHFRT